MLNSYVRHIELLIVFIVGDSLHHIKKFFSMQIKEAQTFFKALGTLIITINIVIVITSESSRIAYLTLTCIFLPMT